MAAKRDGISVQTMVVGLTLAIAWLCWAIAASSYFGAVIEPMESVSGRRGRAAGLQLLIASFVTFLLNSVRLDAIPAVFLNSLRHHPWHFGLFVVLEAAAVGFGLCLKRLEARLNAPRRRRASRSRRGTKGGPHRSDPPRQCRRRRRSES